MFLAPLAYNWDYVTSHPQNEIASGVSHFQTRAAKMTPCAFCLCWLGLQGSRNRRATAEKSLGPQITIWQKTTCWPGTHQWVSNVGKKGLRLMGVICYNITWVARETLFLAAQGHWPICTRHWWDEGFIGSGNYTVCFLMCARLYPVPCRNLYSLPEHSFHPETRYA